MLENQAIKVVSRALLAGAVSGRVRPLQNGQVINLVCYVATNSAVERRSADGLVTRNNEQQDGFLLLDGRFLSTYYLVGSRTTDDSGLYRSPFDSEVELPQGMANALTRCNECGTFEELLQRMFHNLLQADWLPDYTCPRVVRATLRTARTGGTTGLSRWYWLENASLLDAPAPVESITDDDAAAFVARFGISLTNAQDFWDDLSDDAKKCWAALLR